MINGGVIFTFEEFYSETSSLFNGKILLFSQIQPF